MSQPSSRTRASTVSAARCGGKNCGEAPVDVTVQHRSSGCVSTNPVSFSHVRIFLPFDAIALDTFYIGLISFSLALMNIAAIFLMGIIFLYIKSVAPVRTLRPARVATGFGARLQELRRCQHNAACPCVEHSGLRTRHERATACVARRFFYSSPISPLPLTAEHGIH